MIAGTVNIIVHKQKSNEPPHVKTNNGCAPREDSDQWIAKAPSFLHADSEDSDQTGRMPRLTCVFAGRTATMLVLS